MKKKVIIVSLFLVVGLIVVHRLVAKTAKKRMYPSGRRMLLSSYVPPQPGKVKVAFFDADSTLRVSRSGSPSANTPTDVCILPFVAEKLIELEKQGYLIVVVSNQGGVEKGYVTWETANSALLYTCEQLALEGATIHYFDFAEKYNNFRKPNTGMGKMVEAVVKIALDREIDWNHSFMVGDSGWKRKKDKDPAGNLGEDFSNSDRGLAENLKIPFHHPRDYFGWKKHGITNFHKLKQVEEFKVK